MKAIVGLARADLRSRWRGWFLLVALIGLAGGVALTSAAGDRRTDTAYQRLLRSTAGADAQIAVSGPGGRQNVGAQAAFYAAVARLPGVAVVAPTIGLSAVATGRANASVLLRAGTDAALGRAIERPKITAGRMYDPDRADEVVADRTVARQLRLVVGDRLDLLITAGVPGPDAPAPTPVRVRVVGVGITRDNVIPVTAQARAGALLVTPALLHGLEPRYGAFDAAFIGLRSDTSVAAMRREVEALLPRFPTTGGHLFVVDEHEQAATVARAIHPEAVALRLFTLLVALTAVLTIGQAIVRQVAVGAGDHSTLRALGLTRHDLVLLAGVEVGLTIVAGAVLAVAVAVAASPLTPIGPARTAEPHSGVAVNWVVLGGGGLVLVIAFAARLAVPVWRLASDALGATTGASARRGERPSAVLERITRSRAPVTAVIGARFALQPGRGRSALPVWSTVVGTALAVAAIVGAFVFGTNLVRLADTPRLYGQTWPAAVDVEFDQLDRAVVESFLAARPGVSSLTFGNHAEAIIGGRRVATIVLTEGYGPPLFPSVLEGRRPRRKDEIVLGSKTLEATGRHLGQTIAVTLQGETDARIVRIVGRAVFPYFGQGEVSPTGLGEGAAMVQDGPPTDGFNFVLLGTAPGAGGRATLARLRRELPSAGVCHQPCAVVTALRPSDVTDYARVAATPFALAGVLGVLALSTITQLLVISTRRRRRDLAVLKALGLVRRQTWAALGWQATIIVASAMLLGLPVGIAAGRWAWVTLAVRLGAAPSVQVPLPPLLLAVPLGLLVVATTAAAPAVAAGRHPPAAALHVE